MWVIVWILDEAPAAFVLGISDDQGLLIQFHPLPACSPWYHVANLHEDVALVDEGVVIVAGVPCRIGNQVVCGQLLHPGKAFDRLRRGHVDARFRLIGPEVGAEAAEIEECHPMKSRCGMGGWNAESVALAAVRSCTPHSLKPAIKLVDVPPVAWRLGGSIHRARFLDPVKVDNPGLADRPVRQHVHPAFNRALLKHSLDHIAGQLLFQRVGEVQSQSHLQCRKGKLDPAAADNIRGRTGREGRCHLAALLPRQGKHLYLNTWILFHKGVRPLPLPGTGLAKGR